MNEAQNKKQKAIKDILDILIGFDKREAQNLVYEMISKARREGIMPQGDFIGLP